MRDSKEGALLSQDADQIAAEYIKASFSCRELNFKVDRESLKTIRFLRSNVTSALSNVFFGLHLLVPQLVTIEHYCSIITEVTCIMFLTLQLVAEWKIYCWDDFFSNKSFIFSNIQKDHCALSGVCLVLRAVMLLLTFSDIALFYSGVINIRLSWCFIPLFFVLKKRHLKTLFIGCFSIIPRFFAVLTVLCFFIFVWSIYGYFLFGDMSCTWEIICFGSFDSSIRLMILTFLSRPVSLDILNVFGEHPMLSFFLVSYALTTTFWLAQLIVAVANRHFKRYNQDVFENIQKSQNKAIVLAFETLGDGQGEILLPQWMSLYPHLCLHGLPAEKFQKIFQATLHDKPGSTGCDLDTFTQLIKLIQYPLKVYDITQKEAVTEKSCSSSFVMAIKIAQLKVRKLTEFGINVKNHSIYPFPIFFYALIIILLYLQIRMRTNHDSLNLKSWNWDRENTAIIFGLFWAETLLYSFGYGIQAYWSSSYYNKVDILINVLGLVYYAVYYPSPAPFNLFFLTRTFRITRLLEPLAHFVPEVEDITRRAWLVFPAITRATFIAFAIVYQFTTFTYQIYADDLEADALSKDGPNQFVNTWLKYSTVLQFDTFLYSLYTMFNVAFLSNWPIVMYAAKHCSSMSANCTEIIFILFRCIITVYLIPVLLGFIIQRFMIPEFSPKDDFTHIHAAHIVRIMEENIECMNRKDPFDDGKTKFQKRISSSRLERRGSLDAASPNSKTHLLSSPLPSMQYRVGDMVIYRKIQKRGSTGFLLYSE